MRFAKYLITILLASFITPVIAVGVDLGNDNVSVIDNSGTIVFEVGNTSKTYILSARLIANQSFDFVNVTFYMPYGIVNRSACNGGTGFVRINTTAVSCTVAVENVTQPNPPDTTPVGVTVNLTVTANISAYTFYALQTLNFTFTSRNVTGIVNSTTKTITAVSARRNPRPEAVNNSFSNATLIITHWNQTNNGYQVQTPMYTFNPSLGRPVLSNNSYGDVMYFDKSMFERPSYMQLWSYNLTFRVIYNGGVADSNATFVFRSPINNSNPALATQGLMVLNIRKMEAVDFQSNTTFNMTLGTPAPNGFTVYWNGTNQTDTIMLNTYGVNITVNDGRDFDQSISLITVGVSSSNASLINNTDITLLFTMANTTACGSGSCQTSPIFVNSQSISGWSPDSPPKFGEALNTSYIINATNAFTNYTVGNLSMSIMQPMNVTMNISGRIEQFNMTKNTHVSVWNGTNFVENLSVVKKESAFSFIDTHGGDANITLYVTVFDILLTNNTANQESLKGWEPNSNATVVINFSAEMTFPVMNESAVPSGGAGATHNYNATINSPQRAPLNLTAKVPGISNSSTGIVVTIDGSPVASSNLTIGSLTVNDVTAGQHIISVTYTVPAASTTTTTTTTSSGGGGSTPTVTTVTNTLAEALAGKENKITIGSTGINAKEITLEVTEKLTNVKFTTTKLDAKPSAVAEPTAKAFQYINFTTENLPKEKIKSAKIKFNVLKSWLTNNNYTSDDVALYRYTTQWDKLATAKTNETSTEFVFVAETPGFSTFLIAAENVAAATPSPVPAPTPTPSATVAPAATATPAATPATAPTSWYNVWLILFAVAAVILGAGYMMTNKNKKKKLFS